PRRQVPAVRGERVPAVQCITSPFTSGSSAPRVPRETRVTRVPNVCRLQSHERDVHRVGAGMARRARGDGVLSMATEASAGNRPDGRRTAEHGPAGQEPADRGPDDREPATRGPAGNEPPEAPRTGAAEQTPAAKAPAAQDQDDEPAPDRILADIGAALLQLRKSWAKPDLMKRIRAQTPAGTDGRPLQISNLMVVNAVAARSAAAARHGGTGEPVRAGEAAGSSREIAVGAVAERLEIDPSTASRLVGHAIDAGLLTRRPSPVDARRANLGLTEEGRRVKQVADRFRRAYLNELMSGWTAEERAEFARLLTRFADAAARAPGYSDGIDKIFEEARAD